MTVFAYKPAYEWWCFWEVGAASFRENITADVMRYDVKFGCQWNARFGAVNIVSAQGRLVLDASTGKFDLGSANSIFSRGAPTGPITVAFGIAGSDFVWSGLALIQPAPVLDPDRIVTWQLRGRWWQALQQRVDYRDVPEVTSNPTVADITVGPADFLNDYLGVVGEIVGAPAADIRDTIEAPAATNWMFPYVAGTVANSLNTIAANAACVPYEALNGGLGMRPFTSVLNDRTSASAPPAGQRFERRQSRVNWEVRRQPWAVRVEGPDNVSFDSGAVKVFDLQVPRSGWTSSGPVAVTQVEATYALPAELYGVVWSTTTTVPSGWTSATLRVIPSRTGRAVRVVLNATAPSIPANATVPINGWTITEANSRTTLIDFQTLPANAARSIFELPPWFSYDQRGASNTWQIPYGAWMAVANRTMLRTSCVYPLWGVNAASVVRADQLKPGFYAQHRAASDLRYGGMVETVEYFGERGLMPRVRVSTIDISGVYEWNAEDQTSNPDATPPVPVFPPAPPDDIPMLLPPGVPNSLVARYIANDTTIAVTWDAATSGGTANSYRIVVTRVSDSRVIRDVVLPAGSFLGYLIPNIPTDNEVYTVAVSGRNDAGLSAAAETSVAAINRLPGDNSARPVTTAIVLWAPSSDADDLAGGGDLAVLPAPSTGIRPVTSSIVLWAPSSDADDLAGGGDLAVLPAPSTGIRPVTSSIVLWAPSSDADDLAGGGDLGSIG